jgi:hypothetical protein
MFSDRDFMKRLDGLEELLNSGTCTPERVCAELAKVFETRITEVGLLRVIDQTLRFVHPVELQSAGFIPLPSSAVAARTAVGKIPEMFNQFATVPHHTFVETVKLKDIAAISATQQTIQKLMSAPILDESNETIGVVQVSRKGISPAAAGADFTIDDLDTLERAARRVAYLLPELLHITARTQPTRLTFMDHGLAKKKA